MADSEIIGAYTTSVQHVLAELERLDLLIQAQVWQARRASAAGNEGLQGLYVSEEEIIELLAQPRGLPRWAAAPGPPALPEVQAALARRKTESVRQGVVLRLDELARLFQLAPLDIDILLLGLAPEIDSRYERLYAYLQDDINKKRPTVDLALNLLCPSLEAKLAARQRFTPRAPLLYHQLLQLFDDPNQRQPPLLNQYFKVAERVVSYLLDADEIEVQLLPYVRRVAPQVQLQNLILPAEIKQRLALITQSLFNNCSPTASVSEAPFRAQLETPARMRAVSIFQTGPQELQLSNQGPVLYFQGPYGVGKQTTAAALCGEWGVDLLVLDGERLLNTQPANFNLLVRLAKREVQLLGAALYWEGFEALLVAERRPQREALLTELESWPGWVFLAGNVSWEPADALNTVPFVRVEFPVHSATERLQLWVDLLGGDSLPRNDLESLAGKFRFTAGQIRDAVATARNLVRGRRAGSEKLTLAELYTACRLQSNHQLGQLAGKIIPHYTWEDIVLPRDQLEQLREIRNYVKYRTQVYDAWGFDRKLSLGKGLNVLFAGPSGTGKTMAAEIIAGELGLELYRIDLSTMVSKYIGETEKNLARIFAEAEASNAILFFDEADALFGKRTEVRDSHDRYANIETSYLLQQMEAYTGVVILATNLRKNMDEAFVRRMHFTIDFPFPGEKERRRIWERIWPPETPRHSDLNIELLSRKIEVAGGNIRNIALAAAFLAAADGGVVTLPHLLRATRREYQKIGKVITDKEFMPEVRHA